MLWNDPAFTFSDRMRRYFILSNYLVARNWKVFSYMLVHYNTEEIGTKCCDVNNKSVALHVIKPANNYDASLRTGQVFTQQNSWCCWMWQSRGLSTNTSIYFVCARHAHCRYEQYTCTAWYKKKIPTLLVCNIQHDIWSCIHFISGKLIYLS